MDHTVLERRDPVSGLPSAVRETRLADNCWEALLLLARRIKAFPSFPEYCQIRLDDAPEVSIDSPLAPAPRSQRITVSLDHGGGHPGNFDAATDVCVRVSGLAEASFDRPSRLPGEIQSLLKLYLPLCFLSLQARRLKRAVSLSHFAQSLDGWVATISGDSRWIGGPGNLVHAHRMRALLDAVLIGSRTLNLDSPQLTVRHVKGDNPVRVVVGRDVSGLGSLLRSSPDPVILMGGQAQSGERRSLSLPLKRRNGFIPTGRILKELYKRGVHSVYIEGGAITVSRFLLENNLDIVQVHIAPLILGPGLTGFLLPPAQKISQALRFTSLSFTPIDDGIMFTGLPRRPAGKA
jgi:riboflavin-specific deaminase-like protein